MSAYYVIRKIGRSADGAEVMFEVDIRLIANAGSIGIADMMLSVEAHEEVLIEAGHSRPITWSEPVLVRIGS